MKNSLYFSTSQGIFSFFILFSPCIVQRFFLTIYNGVYSFYPISGIFYILLFFFNLKENKYFIVFVDY
jgi:hypothetical protein